MVPENLHLRLGSDLTVECEVLGKLADAEHTDDDIETCR